MSHEWNSSLTLKGEGMAKKIEKFEDFIAWQKARKLTRDIYQATNLPEFTRDFGLKDQIRRAAVSIMSNIAEGFERGRASEFHQFLSIAKGSCAELRAQLYVAFDVQYITQAQFQQLMNDAVETGKIIGGLRASVERRKTLA
jgi:four helix bundle protein